MLKLKSLRNFGIFLYLIVYIIFPHTAITQTKKIDLRRNLENALNSRDISFFRENFKEEESFKITKKFSEIIKDFPDAKWQIKKLKSNNQNEKIFQIKVIGKKVVEGEIYTLESNFNFLFYIVDGKINKSSIRNLFTLVRNDNKKIDITFNIPERVLTGAKYDIDIILNKPLEEVIIAGGLKPHQDESFLEQEVTIEPLVSGGIFKVTRAPSKPGTQIWSGIIAHPKGIITFTKSIEIVEKI